MREAALGVLAIVMLHAHPALSQPSAHAVSAEELFTEGRNFLAQHRFKEACEAFDASEKLDPAVGTLFSLGECYEGEDRTASAWFAYRAAVALAAQRNDPRRSVAEERAARLQPRLTTLVVDLGDPALQASTEVSIDGEAFAREALRAPIAVDPGLHTVQADAEGRQPWSAQVDVRSPGERFTIRVPVLSLREAPDRAERSKRGRAARRTAGAALAGVGLVAVGVGSIFGLQAIEKGRDANEACPSGGLCANAGAVNENNTAKTFADTSTVMIPIGALAVAAGAGLFLASREPRAPQVELSACAGGAKLRLGWAW